MVQEWGQSFSSLTECWRSLSLALCVVAAGNLRVHLQKRPKEKHKHKHKDKERDKDKDKKKKRRRDSETNGDVHDKDKRSNKIQRTEHVNEVLGLENGRVPEMKGATSAVAVENRLQTIERVQAGSSKRDYPLDCETCESAVYIKDKETNGKIDSEFPLILARSVRNSNGAVVSDLAPSPRQNPAYDNEFNRQRHTQFIPQKEGVWSAVDDQEWLFLRNNQLRSKPKAEEGGTSLVWAEAVLLPCVDIYALPYVVPY